jgi:hypothetical protein
MHKLGLFVSQSEEASAESPESSSEPKRAGKSGRNLSVLERASEKGIIVRDVEPGMRGQLAFPGWPY